MKAVFYSYYPYSLVSFVRSINLEYFLYLKIHDIQTSIVRYFRKINRETAPNHRLVIGLEKHALQEDGGEYSGLPQESMPSDTVGKGYPTQNGGNKNKKKSKGISKYRNKILLGGAAAGITSVVIAVSVALPGFLINHLKDIITGKIGDLQTRQQARYRRSKLSKVSDIFSKDGRIGGKIIQDMELRGYKFAFDADGKTIRGITLPGQDVSIVNNDLGAVSQHIDGYLEVRHPLRSSRWKTRRMEAFYTRYGVSRTSVVSPRPGDPDNPDQAVNKHLFTDSNEGALDPELRARSELPDDATDEDIALREAQDDIAKNSGDFDDIAEALAEGVPEEEIGSVASKLDQVSKGVGPDLVDMVSDIENDIDLGSKAFGVGKGAFLTTDFADKVCIIKNRLRTVVTAMRSKKALANMRYAMAVVGASDATKSNKAKGELLGSLLKRSTAVDVNGNPIGASPGIIYAVKNKFSKTQNDSKRSAYAVDGKLSGSYKAIQDNTQIPGCGVWQNPIFQVGSAVVEVVATIFTGGGAKAALAGGKTAVVTSVKNAMTKALASSVAKGVAKSIAVELSFEGIMILTQMYAERSLAFDNTGQEVGASFGDVIAAGGGKMSEKRSVLAGQVPATTEEYAVAHDIYLAELEQEKQEQSVFARIFDYNNLDSLAFNTVTSVPMSTTAIASTTTKSLSSGVYSVGGIFKTLASMVSPSVYAADESDEIAFDTYVTEGDNSGIELATDPAGNLLTVMREDIAAIDPEENIQFLKQNGYIDINNEPVGEFEKHVENCVYAMDVISRIEGSDMSKPENDCLAKLTITTRFKAHLAYMDMMDGLEAEFYPESLNSSETSTVEETVVYDPTGPKNQDTSKLPCAAGASSERVVPIGDGSKSIKLCSYGEIRDVNASWSENVSKMIAEAKKTIPDGWAGGGFRTAEKQISLRRDNCGTSTYAIYEKPSSQCSPPTARPGTSNHELGLAIDFQNMCYPNSTCPPDERYNWLVANASRFGIKKLSSEAWHWSVDGR